MTTLEEKPKANGKPVTGSVTGLQSTYGGFGNPLYAGSAYAGVAWPGGGIANPLGWPGWLGGAYAPNDVVYRWMLQHPTIRAVREHVVGQVCAAPWAIDANGDVDTDAATKMGKQWQALRDEWMPEALRCLDYGRSCFEPIWEQDDDGDYYLPRFKSLWTDWTWPTWDGSGDFTGFRAALRQDLTAEQAAAIEAAKTKIPGSQDPDLSVAQFKALLITYDGEGGNLWGRSQLENLRLCAWIPWLLCAQQLAALGGKISGRQAYAMVPAGQYQTESGPRTFRQDALDALTAFANGRCPVLTNLAFDADDPELKAKLAQSALVAFETVDFGSNSTAIAGLLSQLEHFEGLMWHGYLQSPRSGMESQHGSRADAEQHSSNDTLFCQRLAKQITAKVQPFVDEQARLNLGAKRGQVRLVQSDIEDAAQTFRQSLINAGLGSQSAGAEVAGRIDWEKTAKECSVATRDYEPPLEPVPATSGPAEPVSPVSPAKQNPKVKEEPK